MDSPEPNQTGTPISNFEDSPVFNFLNSLSPIKPARSTHIAQTFNSPSFASPPSVFASPHFSSQRESRFLRRHCFSGSSKPDLLSENGNNGNTNAVVMDAVQVSPHSADPPKSFDPGGSNENLESAIELPRSLKYDCGSPMAVMSDTPERLFKCIQGVSIERCNSFRSGVDLQETSQVEQTKEDRTGCDFKSLISDATDLLVFDSSSDSEASRELDQKIVGPETISINSLQSKETDLVEFGEPKDTDHTPHILSSTFQNKREVNFPSAKKADKIGNCIPVSCKQQHGIRRRCLVFEIAGAQKKLEDKFNSNSSVSSQSDRNQGSSPCMLPGIGLHLNALAANTKSARVVKHKIMASGKQLIRMPSSIVSSDSSSSEQKPLTKSLSLRSMKTDMGPAGNANEVQVVQHASHAFVSRVGEDFKESSPNKKRCKLERVGENEACKRCNCKKSKCLKLYCECFAAGVYCMEPCSCQECFNKPIHEDTVLATRKQIETRNPLAFAPKVIRSSESLSEVGEESNQTPASARHKRGCNCKKSSCLKKYCECYQGGVGCSINCRCEGCKNAFGRKDGSTTIRTEETKPEDEETETHVDQSSHNDDVLMDEEQYQDRVLPISHSFQICRMSVQLPFSSIGKIAQHSPPIQPNFEKHLESIPEDDDTPEILRGNNCSPISGVNKTVSPNGKRVSPPHSEFVLSPGQRNCRKLVLKSIPAFPSLNHNENGDHLQ